MRRQHRRARAKTVKRISPNHRQTMTFPDPLIALIPKESFSLFLASGSPPGAPVGLVNGVLSGRARGGGRFLRGGGAGRGGGGPACPLGAPFPAPLQNAPVYMMTTNAPCQTRFGAFVARHAVVVTPHRTPINPDAGQIWASFFDSCPHQKMAGSCPAQGRGRKT